MRLYSNGMQVGKTLASILEYATNRCLTSVIGGAKYLGCAVTPILQRAVQCAYAIVRHLRRRPLGAIGCAMYLLLAMIHATKYTCIIYAVIGILHLIEPHQ